MSSHFLSSILDTLHKEFSNVPVKVEIFTQNKERITRITLKESTVQDSDITTRKSLKNPVFQNQALYPARQYHLHLVVLSFRNGGWTLSTPKKRLGSGTVGTAWVGLRTVRSHNWTVGIWG